MLKGITWGQFSSFILVVAGVYYLYVFAVYYKAGALGAIRRKGRAAPAQDAMNDREAKEDGGGEAAAAPEKLKGLAEGKANQGQMSEGRARQGAMLGRRLSKGTRRRQMRALLRRRFCRRWR